MFSVAIAPRRAPVRRVPRRRARARPGDGFRAVLGVSQCCGRRGRRPRGLRPDGPRGGARGHAGGDGGRGRLPGDREPGHQRHPRGIPDHSTTWPRRSAKPTSSTGMRAANGDADSAATHTSPASLQCWTRWGNSVDESQVSVPLPVRLRFGHAAVQRLADGIGVDLLHIKGAAVDPSLRPGGYAGSDMAVRACADLRPRRVEQHRPPPVLPRHPARARTRIRRVLVRSARGRHRRGGMPRAGRARAGGAARAQRGASGAAGETRRLRGVGCTRRAAPGDRTARGPSARRSRLRRRGRGLERYVDARDYRLWKVVSEGGSRSEEWWARIRAAPSVWAGLRSPRVRRWSTSTIWRIGSDGRRRDATSCSSSCDAP